MERVSKPARTSPLIRVSYPQVFAPRAVNIADTPKYGVVLMLEKNNPEHVAFLTAIHGDLQATLNEAWPDPATRPRIPLVGESDSPIKDGDTTVNRSRIPIGEKDPEYRGHYIIRASSTTKPWTVDANVQELMDQGAIYGGAYCKVSINAYSYSGVNNQGVTLGLNGIQKIRDGESFGGGRPPLEGMFGVEGGDDPANYAQPPAAPFGQPAPQQPAAPFGQPAPQQPAAVPFGQPAPQQPAAVPFGQPAPAAPFGQPAPAAPFGQPAPAAPFGQPAPAAPFGQPSPVDEKNPFA